MLLLPVPTAALQRDSTCFPQDQRHRLIRQKKRQHMMKMKAEADPTRVSIAWQEPAMAQIGKSGVSDNLVKEIVRLLKKHQYIKVRILRSSLGEASKAELINELCTKTRAHLAGTRGNTAVIFRYRASQRA